MLKQTVRYAKSTSGFGRNVPRSHHSCTVCSSSSFSPLKRTTSTLKLTHKAFPRAALSTFQQQQQQKDQQQQQELQQQNPDNPPPPQGYNSRHLSRSRGSVPKEEAYLEYLQRKTNRILSLRRPPFLGALDDGAWNETISLMEDWMINPGRYQDQHENPDASQAPALKLSGFALNAVELLLGRLQAEQATLGSQTLRRFERDAVLAQWQVALLHGWLQLVEQQQNPNDDNNNSINVQLISAMCERSERALGWVVEWYNRGGWSAADSQASEDPLPVAAFASLVQQWLRVDNGQGAVRAADLLISWTDGEAAISLLEDHKEAIGICYNQAWAKCANILQQQQPSTVSPEVREQVKGVAITLASRMDLLREHGWGNLDKVTDQVEKLILVDALSGPSIDPKGSPQATRKARTSFEEDMLQQRMIDMVSTADENDLEMITHKLIPSIRSLDSLNPDVALALATALAEYFVRMKDAKRASKWVQRADQLSTSNQLPKPKALFRDIFYLWLNHEGEQSLWRADEILRRLEHLEKSGQTPAESTVLDATMYEQLITRWNESAENSGEHSRASRKIRELFWRQISEIEDSPLDISALQQYLDSMANDSETMENTPRMKQEEAEKLLALLEKHLDHATDEHGRENILGCLAQLLSLQPSLAAKAKTAVNEALSHNSLSDKFNYQFYDAALRNLYDNQNSEDSLAAVKDLFMGLLDRVTKGKMEEESASIGPIVVNLLSTILGGSKGDQKRADAAEDLLLAAEKALLSLNEDDHIRKQFQSSPFTTEDFTAIMNLFRAPGHYDKAESIFLRLEDYHGKGGYSDLTPDKHLYEAYIDILGFKSFKTGADADEPKNALDRLIELYQSSNFNDMYRPTQHSFFRVIHTYRGDSTQTANSILEVLSNMTDLFAATWYEKVDPQLFDMAIRKITSSGVEDIYGKIVSLIYESYIMDPKLDVEPLAVTKHRVLEATKKAPVEQGETAIKIALALLIDIRGASQQTAETYILYCVCLRDLVPHRQNLRDQLAIAGYQACCDDGLLSHALTKKFRNVISPEYWVDLKLAPGTEQPESWSRLIEGPEKARVMTDDNLASGSSSRQRQIEPQQHTRQSSTPTNALDAVNHTQYSSADTAATSSTGVRGNRNNYTIDLDAVQAGRETRTTVIVRNIPNKYTQQILLSEFTEDGLGPGVIDYLFLPIDFETDCNRGYAFINFVNSKDIVAFHQQYYGKKWRIIKSNKRCELVYARSQGKKWLSPSLVGKDDKYQPMFFENGRRIPMPIT